MWWLKGIFAVLMLVVTGCSIYPPGPSVVMTYPPYQAGDPRVHPGLGFPAHWVRVTVPAYTVEAARERVEVPEHETRGWQIRNGAIYIPPYRRKVIVAGRTEIRPGEVRFTDSREEERQIGNYWDCREPPIPGCRPDGDPPPEFQAQVPVRIRPPTAPPVERPQVAPPMRPQNP